jgi:hypothetical protein
MSEEKSQETTQSTTQSTNQTNNTTQRRIDYLTEDSPIDNQRYVCVSFVSPEGIKNCTIRSFKVRGVFEKYEEARAHAEKLQKLDPAYHIFVGEVGKWLPWDPNPDSAKDQHYYEKELQNLHEGYLKNREKAKMTEAERKRDMLQRSVAETARSKNTGSVRDRLQQRVQENKQKKEQDELEKMTTQLKTAPSQTPPSTAREDSSLGTVNDNLAKLKDLLTKQQEKKE